MIDDVLAQYPATLCNWKVTPLGSHGGFSGARLWRVDGLAGAFCLKGWPTSVVDRQRLAEVHRLMLVAGDRGLAFVPHVVPTRTGKTFVREAGRFWDVTTWLPGHADFRERPETPRLAAACRALAQLHLAWADQEPGQAPCPAVQRRLETHRRWTSLLDNGWKPNIPESDPVAPLAERAWLLLREMAPSLPDRLAPWLAKPLPVQPCLCDVWHDHVLFRGDEVTGLIDYGSVKQDHVAVDLARLLGSLVGDDQTLRAAALQAYQESHALSVEEKRLVDDLDQTGTILGAANWLMWLYHDQRAYEDRTAVAARLDTLVKRIGEW